MYLAYFNLILCTQKPFPNRDNWNAFASFFYHQLLVKSKYQPFGKAESTHCLSKSVKFASFIFGIHIVTYLNGCRYSIFIENHKITFPIPIERIKFRRFPTQSEIDSIFEFTAQVLRIAEAYQVMKCRIVYIHFAWIAQLLFQQIR